MKCGTVERKSALNERLDLASERSMKGERADCTADARVKPFDVPPPLRLFLCVRVCVDVFGCMNPSAHRSDGEGQHGHHPVPQADQLPQLPLLLPAVASLRQQTGHVDQDAHSEKHRLDHLQKEFSELMNTSKRREEEEVREDEADDKRGQPDIKAALQSKHSPHSVVH